MYHLSESYDCQGKYKTDADESNEIGKLRPNNKISEISI